MSSRGRPLALIAGGTSGIGFGIAKELAAEWDLALAHASDHARAQAARRALSKSAPPGAMIEVFPGRLGEYSDAERLVEAVEARCGTSPSALINSAGSLADGWFMGSDFARHEVLLKDHLVVAMGLCHRVLPSMYRARFGRILNVTSISATRPNPGQTSYAAAKAGLEAFTRTLALEVAHRGITVNAIAPGLIDTPLTAERVSAIREAGEEELHVPVGFVGSPGDVGHLARFLCSGLARYITGVVYAVDGGRSLGGSVRGKGGIRRATRGESAASGRDGLPQGLEPGAQ